MSPNGDDKHPGTAESPLRTISRAAELAAPGDIVLVKAGVYRERVAPARGGEPGRPIVYRGEPGKRVYIKGSNVWTPNWRDEGDGIYSATPDPAMFDDRSDEYVDHHNPFKVQLASTPWGRQGRREQERRDAGDKRIGRADARIVYTCGQVFVNGKRYREVPLAEELQVTMWHYDAADDRIRIHFGHLDPAKQNVEITTRRRIFAPKERGLGHIVVEGFIFEHCGNQYPTDFWMTDANAQKGAVGTEAGHHWIVRRNVIRHAKTFALDVGRVDRHSQRTDAHDNLIESNYILENGSAGILTSGSRNLIIRNNVIVYNNQLRFEGIKRWEQAAIKAHAFRDGLIENNYLANNYKTYGVWLDNQFPDCRVTRNVIFNNGSAGIFLEMSDYDYDRALIDHNVIIANQKNAVYIHDASGATFMHNLLAGTRGGDQEGQAIYIRQLTTRTRSRHHSFFNNLLIDNARHIDVCYPAGRSGPQRFESNLYGVNADSRSFVINHRIDAPIPWTQEVFFEKVAQDLGLNRRKGDDEMFNDRKAHLTCEQWQQFWQRHGQRVDRHSRFDPNAAATYNPTTHTLKLTLRINPADIRTVSRKGIERDFFGLNLREVDRVTPGPFQHLKRGENSFVIWRGLPVLEEGQLPPAEWTRSDQVRDVEGS